MTMMRKPGTGFDTGLAPTGPNTPEEVQRYRDLKVEQTLVREDVRRLERATDRERPKEDERHRWAVIRDGHLAKQAQYEGLAAREFNPRERSYWVDRARIEGQRAASADVALAGLR